MTGELWPSAFVAAVFAIHPLRVESVAWVSERKDVLSGLFFMLTLAAYVGYVRRPFSLVRYLAVVVLFALGLMAKPMLVTLPFVLLLLDYWPLGAHVAVAAPWRLVVEKLPLLALSAASCVVNAAGPGRGRCSRLDVLPLAVADRPTPWFPTWPTWANSSIRWGWRCFYPHPEKQSADLASRRRRLLLLAGISRRRAWLGGGGAPSCWSAGSGTWGCSCR